MKGCAFRLDVRNHKCLEEHPDLAWKYNKKSYQDDKNGTITIASQI